METTESHPQNPARAMVADGDPASMAYRRRWWILFVLCFSLLVITLDNTILNVALPTIVDELKATNSELQWMVDSYTLVFAGLLLTAGALGDRFGRRGALQLGLLAFGAGSLLSALAADPTQLIVTRGLMGIGGALIMPATLSILTNVFPPKERGPAIGIWAGVAGIGIALGPLFGGILLEHFYWGSVFLVNLPIVVGAAILAAVLVPTSKDPSVPKLDPVGAALSILGLSALLWAIIEAPEKGWLSAATIAIGGAGLVLIAAFALWEAFSTHPMLDVRFFKKARFTAASLAVTLVFFGLFGTTFLLTQYFQFVLAYSPLETGVRLLPFALTLMVTAPLSARAVKRVGTKVVVATGLGLVTVGLLLLLGVGVGTPYADIVWRMMVMAVGMGLTMAPATDSIMGSLPLAKAGVGSAVNDTTRMVGGSLGVAVIGSVLSSIYASKVADVFAGKPVPKSAQAAAEDQLGAALVVAKEVAHAAPSLGAEIASAAKHAFVDGFHAGAVVGAVATVIGVVIVIGFLPARARPEDIEAQTADRAREFEA